MKYHGKLYGKLWDKYFDTSYNTDDWDAMKKRIAELESENEARRTRVEKRLGLMLRDFKTFCRVNYNVAISHRMIDDFVIAPLTAHQLPAHFSDIDWVNHHKSNSSYYVRVKGWNDGVNKTLNPPSKEGYYYDLYMSRYRLALSGLPF